jgi:hypothetical protein
MRGGPTFYLKAYDERCFDQKERKQCLYAAVGHLTDGTLKSLKANGKDFGTIAKSD